MNGDGGAKGLSIVAGPNFSGRSRYLQQWSDALSAQGRRGVYVGPDVHNHLSGLMSTVGGEFEIHGHPGSALRAWVDDLLEAVGGRSLWPRHPLTLSGGQQAVVALATALLTRPHRLAVDGSLEQLHPDTRRLVLQVLRRAAQEGIDIRVADNRLAELPEALPLSEWAPPPQPVVPAEGSERPLAVPVAAGPLRSGQAWQGCALDLRRLSFAYRGGPPVLDAVSCRLEPGQVYVLQGPNGVGKSTLCKLLCGVLRPSAGGVYSGTGAPLNLWRRPGTLAFCHFQNPDLQLFATTVRAELRQADPQAVQDFGLVPVADCHPHDLPFVLRKRVALAAALGSTQPWLILDEPILGQDDATAMEIAAMATAQAAAGRGVIVVTHSRWFACQMSGFTSIYLDRRTGLTTGPGTGER